MESIPVWDTTGQTGPSRIATLFMANGINPKHWSAKGVGADME